MRGPPFLTGPWGVLRPRIKDIGDQKDHQAASSAGR
jgi:hypothetical protein